MVADFGFERVDLRVRHVGKVGDHAVQRSGVEVRKQVPVHQPDPRPQAAPADVGGGQFERSGSVVDGEDAGRREPGGERERDRPGPATHIGDAKRGRTALRKPGQRGFHEGFGIRPGNERFGTDRESQAEELDLADQMLQGPAGRPCVDQSVERVHRRGREPIPGPRDEFGGGPAGRGAQQESGVKLRRVHSGTGEPLRTRAEGVLDREFVRQRLSAFKRSDCSRAWRGSIKGSSSPLRTFGRECRVSAIRWSVMRFSLKL